MPSKREAAHFLKNLGAEKIFADELLKQGVIFMTENPTRPLVVKKPIGNLAEFSALTLRSTGALASTSPKRARKPWQRLPESFIKRSEATFSTARIGAPRRAHTA